MWYASRALKTVTKNLQVIRLKPSHVSRVLRAIGANNISSYTTKYILQDDYWLRSQGQVLGVFFDAPV